jgi:predicted metalloprotease with PDZ domain
LLAGTSAAAQDRPDTLVYDVAVVTLQPAHLSVEARLTTSAPGNVTLASPPSALPAGAEVAGLSVSDDRGRLLRVRRTQAGYEVGASAGAVRFRYRLDFQNDVAVSSTGAGLSDDRLYAVSRSVFVAPDPAAYQATGRSYPIVWIHVAAPPGWHVVTGWGVDEEVFTPSGPEALLGTIIAAAPDFRVYRDTAAGTPFVLAIRGQRPFSDSGLLGVVAATLRGASRSLGPVPVPRVTYIGDLGSQGHTSSSLQGLASVGFVWGPGEPLERARIRDVFHETLHLWFGGAMVTDRWWTEGATDYFAARLLADWSNRPGDLVDLCDQSLRNYRQIPYRTSMTMREEQRSGVLGDNTTLLVYRKGMLAALLLDAAIRRGSDGQANLVDVARQMLATAGRSPARRVSASEIRSLAVEAGGVGVARVWRRVVDGTAALGGAEIADALGVVSGRSPVRGDNRHRIEGLDGQPQTVRPAS